MKRLLVPALLLPLALVLSTACDKGKDDKKDEGPKYEAGAMVDKELAQLGGVQLKLPDNLKVSEAEGEAKLEAEGFPTVTINYEKKDNNGSGSGMSGGGGKVEAELMIPTATWTCKAEGVGEHEDLVKEICKSLVAPKLPNVSKMTCKTVTGFEADPVNAAWSGSAEAFTKCFEALEDSGLSFGFNFKLEGASRNFTKYTSPMVKDEGIKKCVDAVYAKLEADPAFTKEGLEAGQIECDGSYSLY